MIWNDFIPSISKLTKIYKKSQNLLKVLPKTVLFRNIALIFNLEKPCYLENRVVREPCKQRSACICSAIDSASVFSSQGWVFFWQFQNSFNTILKISLKFLQIWNFHLAPNPSFANLRARFLSCVTDFWFFFTVYLLILFSLSWCGFMFSTLILFWVVFAKASNINSLGLGIANFFFFCIRIHWCSPLQKLYSQCLLIGLLTFTQTIFFDR